MRSKPLFWFETDLAAKVNLETVERFYFQSSGSRSHILLSSPVRLLFSQEPVDMYTQLGGATFDDEYNTVSIKLPYWAFSEVPQGKYKTCITLGATPGSTSKDNTLSTGVCGAASLRCPVEVDGACDTPLTPFEIRPTASEDGWGHFGVDYAVPPGKKIVAAAGGIVVSSYNGVFGRTVVLQHNDGSTTLYAPFEIIIAIVGQVISVGDHLGYGKMDGYCGGHLHFQYAPNANLYRTKDLVDPHACVALLAEGSITVRDSGTSADDMFAVSLNGMSIGETTYGPINSVAASNLQSGTVTLTLLVTHAPDSSGTWVIKLKDGLKFPNGSTQQSGVNDEGFARDFAITVP